MPDIDLQGLVSDIDLAGMAAGRKAATHPAGMDQPWSPHVARAVEAWRESPGPIPMTPDYEPGMSLSEFTKQGWEGGKNLALGFVGSARPTARQAASPREVRPREPQSPDAAKRDLQIEQMARAADARNQRRALAAAEREQFLESQHQYHPPGQPLDPGVPPGHLVRARSNHPGTDLYVFNNQAGQTKGHWSVSRTGEGNQDLWVNVVRNVIPGKEFAAGENTMGRKAALDMIRQLFEKYPDVKRIGGHRAGGANPGRDWWVRRDQAVTDAMLIAIFGPMLGYTLTPVDHDPFAHAD